MNDTVWSLDRYAKLEKNTWSKVEGCGDLDLIKQGLQLLVIHQGTAIDSITLSIKSSNIKAYRKGSTMGICLRYNSVTRRIQLKFSATRNYSNELNCCACAHMLQAYMTVRENTGLMHQENLQLSELLDNVLKSNSTTSSLVPEFQTVMNTPELDTIIRSCLLDPGFPNFICEIQKRLELYTSFDQED